MVANMHSAAVGLIKWTIGMPPDRRMVRIIDDVAPVQRRDLGDDNPDLWEVDDKGRPRDPWSFCNELEMADPATAEVFTFRTTSMGGRRAFDKLCKAYGAERARHPDEWPLIQLGVSSYAHSDKSRGLIKEPVFTVIGWADKNSGGSTPPSGSSGGSSALGRPTLAAPAAFLRVDNPLGEPPHYEDSYPGFTEDDFH
jgi:hypothetical protein